MRSRLLHTSEAIRITQSLFVIGFVVHTQQVGTEVAVVVTPDRVDVIRIVLGAIVFEQEDRCLNPIVMTFSRFSSTHPGEANIFRRKQILPFFHLLHNFQTILGRIHLDQIVQ